MQDNTRLIVRVANALDLGVSPEDIHAMLIAERASSDDYSVDATLTEEEAYLTYQAGRLLHKSRQ